MQWEEIELDHGFKQIQRIAKDVAYRYAPVTMLHHKKFNWIDNKIIREINKRDQLFKQWTEDPTNQSKRLSFAKQNCNQRFHSEQKIFLFSRNKKICSIDVQTVEAITRF